eukprot:CAMPEP_0182434670 /NCGR_PEP_ID=MMETSP1167-20130531/71092_1 /TAXON_ID=2988 /ORGANISM="Mallomonas Sp, Strain CCMP3275" /LENGTH=62 /DNA_ID=CAMNT_0024624795 /DNA_START=354 /DNA_END=539 /DNA_ORIENTATION=+
MGTIRRMGSSSVPGQSSHREDDMKVYDNVNNSTSEVLLVELDKRDRSGIAEGQFAAFYRDEV